jgi:hypothetical protein
MKWKKPWSFVDHAKISILDYGGKMEKGSKKDIEISDQTVRACASFIGSILGYYYAKEGEAERIPSMLFGGFIGNVVGSYITNNHK